MPFVMDVTGPGAPPSEPVEPKEPAPKKGASAGPGFARTALGYGVGLAAPVVGGMLGAASPVPGGAALGAAAGGAGGEWARQKIMGEEQDLANMGVNAAISAIPGGLAARAAKSTLGKVAAHAAEGAVIGAGAEVGHSLLHGDEVSPGKAALAGLGGGVLGGGVAALEKPAQRAIAAAAQKLGMGEPEALKSLRLLLNPGGAAAPHDTNIITGSMGRRSNELWRAARAMEDHYKLFDGRDAEGLDFIHRFQHDIPQEPHLQQLDGYIRQLNENIYHRVNAYKEMPHLESFFPQIWERKDQAAAEALFGGKRPWRGSMRSFHKRVYDDMQKGMVNGLTPISKNPVVLELAYLHDMTKFIAANEVFNTFKDIGRLRWLPEGARMPQPQGAVGKLGPQIPDATEWAKIDDGIAKRFFPPGQVPLVIKKQPIETLLKKYTQSFERVTQRSAQTTSRTGGAAPAGGVHTPAGKVEERVMEALTARGFSAGEASQMVSRLKKAATSGEEQAPGEVIREVVEKLHVIERERGTRVNLPDEMRVKGRVATQRFTPAGQWIAEKNVARLINNGLAGDLIRESPTLAAAVKANYLMNALQLGWSAWHAMFVSIDSSASEAALGLENLLRGAQAGLRGEGKQAAELTAKAAKHILTSAPVLAAPTKYWREGNQFFKGGRGTELEKWLEAGGANLQTKGQYFQPGGWGSWDNFRLAARQGKLGSAAVQFPFAVTDAAMRPLFEKVIPRMKVGAFASLMRNELERQSQKGPVNMETAARETWANIENRLGELNYDNLFWNRMFKTAMQLSFRAVGFNVGTVRELGGGIFQDTPKAIMARLKGESPEFTPKMQYMMGLMMTVVGMGGVYHYLHTGEEPSEVKDFLYPKNGEKDEHGNDVRVQLPTYFKDAWGLMHHPLQKVSNKMAPLLSTVWALLQNRDFMGNQIYNEGKGLLSVPGATQAAKYLVQEVTPFGVHQFAKLGGGGITEQKLEGLVGIAKAPREVTESPGLVAARGARTSPSQGPLTPEQHEAQEANRTRRGKLQAAMGFPLRPEDRALRQLNPAQRAQVVVEHPELKERPGGDPVVTEFARLGILMPQATETFKAHKQVYKLPPDVAQEWAQARGEEIRKALGPVIGSPGYQQLPAHVQKDIVERQLRRVHERVLVRMRPAIGRMMKDQAAGGAQKVAE